MEEVFASLPSSLLCPRQGWPESLSFGAAEVLAGTNPKAHGRIEEGPPMLLKHDCVAVSYGEFGVLERDPETLGGGR